MKRAFFFSFVAGLALVAAAAAVYPLPKHERYLSSIEVLTNGGRREDFIIQWPQDRVRLPAVPDGLQALAGQTAFLLASGPQAAMAELFRLRDVSGNVIGLAARISGQAGQANVTRSDWLLLVPSRGSLLLSQQDSGDLGPVRLAGQWRLPAETARFWGRARSRRISAGPLPGGRGRVLRGTGEFRRLAGSYSETWELQEVLADGGTRGRIHLSTITEARR